MTFRRDIMNWPSRGVIASHDYGCPPQDAEGLQRVSDGIARREQALLDARTRKALHLAATPVQGLADERLQSSPESSGDIGRA